MRDFFIKTNRIFNPLRKYAWVFVFLVAVGGLWLPKLGLLIIPVMIALLVMSFLRGKYWCGNICPHGSLFDHIILPISANRKIPGFLKSKTAAVIMLTFFMYMMGGRLIKVLAIWDTAPSLDKLGFVFVVNYLMVTVLGTVLAVFVSPRAWCSFCPMGTMQTLSYKFGKVLGLNKKTDVKVTTAGMELCHSCGKCARVCPMQLSPYLGFSKENQFDHEACIRCSTCVANCPAGILSIGGRQEALMINDNADLEGYGKRKKIAAVIMEIKKLADDVNQYTFQLKEPVKINYEPGQFILVKIQNDPVMYRAYSIAWCSEDGSQLSVSIKKIPGGYGTGIIFNTFREGDLVELDGPMGRELVIGKDADKVLFVAGGVGITPFVPMARDMVKNTAAKKVKLVYGVNKVGELLYDEHFAGLERESSKFEYIRVVASDSTWQGKKGFVTEAIGDMDLQGYKVYMCGPQPMIKATLKVLHRGGVKEEDIFYESA